MRTNNEDIYEYQFNALFQRVNPIIGKSTIKVYDSIEKEKAAQELDDQINESKLLFDVSGYDFKMLKSCDAEYRYWVEVYIIKIIENLLLRKQIWFTENYYGNCKEKHSITYESNKKKVEAYFLFDITCEEATNTDYDIIAEELKSKTKSADHIEIYIFRDCINEFTLAELINNNKSRNADGLVEVLPLHYFFDKVFGANEFLSFSVYANEFLSKCNRIISYKTVITPTQKTLYEYKQKKCHMLRRKDYLAIAKKGQSGELSETEYNTIKINYLKNKMYTAMISSNDFAESFISAEWLYDVYSNSMGELDLTGIIAGYLKSVEQLMFTIVKFHKNKEIKIRTKNKGYQYYNTIDNETIIDSTLKSLNDFLTSNEGKLAHSVRIRGCIKKAVNLWKDNQRNGYFHKHNLYRADNKIDEVREQTIYLYFLILGGIKLSSEEIRKLGVYDYNENPKNEFNQNIDFLSFRQWIDNMVEYDLPKNIPGLWLLMTYDRNMWTINPYLMKYFYIEEFENNEMEFDSEHIELNHLRDIPPFSWKTEDNNSIQASIQLRELFEHYETETENNLQRIHAIIIDSGRFRQLLHYEE